MPHCAYDSADSDGAFFFNDDDARRENLIQSSLYRSLFPSKQGVSTELVACAS